MQETCHTMTEQVVAQVAALAQMVMVQAVLLHQEKAMLVVLVTAALEVAAGVQLAVAVAIVVQQVAVAEVELHQLIQGLQ